MRSLRKSSEIYDLWSEEIWLTEYALNAVENEAAVYRLKALQMRNELVKVHRVFSKDI